MYPPHTHKMLPCHTSQKVAHSYSGAMGLHIEVYELV